MQFLTRVQGPEFPIACVDLLVGRARAHLVPGQGLAYWWAGWVFWLWDCAFLHLVDEAGSEAKASFLECGARAQWVLRLMPAFWWVKLGPGSPGGQSHVQRQLQAQGVLRQPVCWWVGLCSHPVSYLAWGIPALVPLGSWVREGWVLGTITYREDSKMVSTTTSVHVVEETPRNGCHQCLCP